MTGVVANPHQLHSERVPRNVTDSQILSFSELLAAQRTALRKCLQAGRRLHKTHTDCQGHNIGEGFTWKNSEDRWKDIICGETDRGSCSFLEVVFPGEPYQILRGKLNSLHDNVGWLMWPHDDRKITFKNLNQKQPCARRCKMDFGRRRQNWVPSPISGCSFCPRLRCDGPFGLSGAYVSACITLTCLIQVLAGMFLG